MPPSRRGRRRCRSRRAVQSQPRAVPCVESTDVCRMLERSSSSKKNLHVVWNEENLKENEEIQKEYSAVRIQEPKTPYRPPLPSDSLEDEMKPLQLDEVADALEPEHMTAFEYVMSNGGAAYDGAGPSNQQQEAAVTSNVSSEADGDKVMHDVVGDKRSEPCNSFTSSGSEGSGDKRRRFEQMRKQHYNMKDALLKARQLLESEGEEDAGVDAEQEAEGYHEGEEDDTAGWHVANGTAGTSHASQQQPIEQPHGTEQQQSQQPYEPQVTAVTFAGSSGNGIQPGGDAS